MTRSRAVHGDDGVVEAVVLRMAWGSEAGAYAFHRQPEPVVGPARQRVESPLGVPAGSAFVECVDDDRADREMLVCFDDSVQRLLQKPGAELSFLVALVAGEPSVVTTECEVATRLGCAAAMNPTSSGCACLS